MQRHRVWEEGLRVVNHLIVREDEDEGAANYVPAAAVIRRSQALSGFIGCKACVGGFGSLSLKTKAQPWEGAGYFWSGGS